VFWWWGCDMKKTRYVFIDSQNLHLGIKTLGWKLDYKRFFVYLKDKYKVEKVFIFLGYIEENKKMYKYFRKIGYTIIFKPTTKDHRGNVKGNVDAELVLQVMHELPEYDGAIIISGDGDFNCLLKYLVERDKLCLVMIPNRKYCSHLIFDALKGQKLYLFIGDLKNKLKYRKI
jgi:uncharacterized LabA/DUF88 family protein